MTERKNTGTVLEGAKPRRTRKPAADHTVVNAPEHRGLPTAPRAASQSTATVTATLADGTNVVNLDKAKAASKRAPKSKVTGAASVTDLATKRAAKKAPAKKATPAKKAASKKAAAAKPDLTDRAKKAAETRQASHASDQQLTCRVCQLTKPVYKFPTAGKDKDGQVKRGDRCRACRDAGKK